MTRHFYKREAKVVVLIPTLNAEKEIEKTIDSLLQQTYQEFAIAVIDNNSTDRTVQVAETYVSTLLFKGQEWPDVNVWKAITSMDPKDHLTRARKAIREYFPEVITTMMINPGETVPPEALSDTIKGIPSLRK